MTAALSVIEPGDLNRRLVLEEPVETADGAGGFDRSYQAVTTVWASVTPMPPMSSRATTIADNPGARVACRIVIRSGRDVTTRHRFREGERIYRIATIRELSGKRFLDIHAELQID